MRLISGKVKKTLETGVIESGVEKLVEFQLYLVAREILALDKTAMPGALKKIPAALHDDIRKQAKKIISYKKTVFHTQEKNN